TTATGSCGLCCRESGPVGGDVCSWFSPTRSSAGTAELSPGIGPENRDAFGACNNLIPCGVRRGFTENCGSWELQWRNPPWPDICYGPANRLRKPGELS